MIDRGNLVSAIDVLSKVSEMSGTKDKMSYLKSHESEELKYLLFVANCQFVVTHLSNIDINAFDPLDSVFSSEVVDFSGLEAFNFLKDSIMPKLTEARGASNELRNLVSSFLINFNQERQKILIEVLTKRLNIGVSTKSINKIWPDLIPNPSVMLASDDFSNQIKGWNISDIVLNEKFDGVRIVADVDPIQISVRYYTRNFNEVDSKFLPNITEQIRDLSSKYFTRHNYNGKLFFDGELTPTESSIRREIERATAKDEAGISTNSGNIATESRKKISGNLTKMIRGTFLGTDSDFMFNCFDVVEYSGNIFTAKISSMNLKDRLRRLESVNTTKYRNVSVVESFKIGSYEDIMSIYDRLIFEGKEGVIAKLASAPYEMQRSKSWQKLKAINTIDLRVVEVEAGTPGSRNEHRLGNFICRTDGDKLEVNVGSGFSDDQRDQFWKDRKELIGKIVEVEYNTIINDKTGMKSLFLPRFISVRYDKNITDSIA